MIRIFQMIFIIGLVIFLELELLSVCSVILRLFTVLEKKRLSNITVFQNDLAIFYHYNFIL